MYIPKIKDVRFARWQPYKDDKEIADVFIYLADDTTPVSIGGCLAFGKRNAAIVAIEASPKERIDALMKAQQQLVEEFDVAKSAKTQKFVGKLENLQPIPINGNLTLEEMQNVPTKV